jgi:hypothetical protein
MGAITLFAVPVMLFLATIIFLRIFMKNLCRNTDTGPVCRGAIQDGNPGLEKTVRQGGDSVSGALIVSGQ